MNQLNQSIYFEYVNLLILIDQMIRYLLTGNILIIVFLKHHVFISLLPDSLDKSGITEHIRLEIIFTSDFVEIVYSLIELIDSNIEIQNSIITNEIDFDIVVLHFLKQEMSLINQLLVLFFLLISHTHVD